MVNVHRTSHRRNGIMLTVCVEMSCNVITHNCVSICYFSTDNHSAISLMNVRYK